MLENVITLISTIITRKHPCQIELDVDEDSKDAAEELSEFDWIVIDTGMDAVAGLAIALGADFMNIWPQFEKTILRYASSSESLERSTAVGVLADIITGIGSAVTPHTSDLLRLFLRRLTDEDMQTRSNTAYAIGLLVEKSEANQEIVQAYPSILEKIETCLQIKETRLPENSAGCIARMILKHRDQVSIPDVLPALVNTLPLVNDFDENEPVYRMIGQLYKWEDATVRDLTPRLIPAFHAVLTGDPDQLEDERRAELVELVTWLNKMQPGAAPWVEQLGQ